MNANEFWTYVNHTMSHLLLPRERWTRLRDYLKWVSSVNWFGGDYTVARQGFDSIVMGH